jgi:phosphatidylserine synthase
MIFYAPAPVTDRRFAIIVMILTVATAFAMVSPIRYRSQKGLALQKERPLRYFLAVAAILAIAFRFPRELWFAGSIIYLVAGPLVKLWSIAFPTPSLIVAESQSLIEGSPPATPPL